MATACSKFYAEAPVAHSASPQTDFSDSDPTHGTVNYVNSQTARSSGLVYTNDQGQFMFVPFFNISLKQTLFCSFNRSWFIQSQSRQLELGRFQVSVPYQPVEPVALT